MNDGSQRAIGLVVKLPFATREEFLAKYGANISRGGIYLRAKKVKPPGTAVTLDLRLASGERLIHASARVEFTTGLKGQGVSGMGVRFLVVDPATQRFLETALAGLPHAQSLQPPIPPGVGEAEFGPGGPNRGTEAPQVKSLSNRAAHASGGNGASQGAVERPSTPAVGRAPPDGSVPLTTRASVISPISAPPFEAPAAEPQRVGPVVGVDLGTTCSRVAHVRSGKPLVLASADGYDSVPSVLALDGSGKLVVGRPAKGHMLTHPRLSVSGAKRLIGRQFESTMVESAKGRSHYEIARSDEGDAGAKLADRVYSLEQVSAVILREIRGIAQSQLGQDISRAVLTVPGCYDVHQRQAVRQAGQLAGLYVERILTEPVAAALAFGYGRGLCQRIFVYDLGGGTFDASVLEVNGNSFEVISTGGDPSLGGVDFDDAIVGWLIQELEKTTGKRFERDGVAMQRIHEAAERAKCALSERSESRVHLPFVTMVDGRAFDLDATVTREKLFELTEELVDRTLEICREVLEAKHLTPGDIAEVLLVGAQSRLPLVREKIQRFFGKPPAQGLHPDEAVALGAGLLASSLDRMDAITVADVLPMSIGIGLPGGAFQSILERNTRLPAKQTHVVRTSRDDQTELDVLVFQGVSAVAVENEYLGTISLSGLSSSGSRGRMAIALTFEISHEGLLKVSAQEQRTGREVSLAFTRRDTPEALQVKLQKSEEPPLSGDQPVPVTASENAGQAASTEEADAPVKNGGFVGWVRRLFGG